MGRVNSLAKDGQGIWGELRDIIHATTGEFRDLIELMDTGKARATSAATTTAVTGATSTFQPTGAGHGYTPPTEWMMNVMQKGGAGLWSEISAAASTNAGNVAGRFNALNEALQAGHTPEAIRGMLAGLPSAAKGGFVKSAGLVNVHAGETITPAGGGVYINVNVEGSVSSERELVEAIRKGLLQAQKSGRSVVLN